MQGSEPGGPVIRTCVTALVALAVGLTALLWGAAAALDRPRVRDNVGSVRGLAGADELGAMMAGLSPTAAVLAIGP